MASVSTYLNFMGNCEEAFSRYAEVFGTEPSTPLMRMGDMPPMEGGPELSADEQKRVMHVALPTLDGHLIMGTDMLESMGHELTVGNNVTISLNPDTRTETDRLYAGLSDGGTDCAAPADMFWGYWGTCQDRFGIRWMFNCEEPAAS
jgi:PhnB protein